MAVVRVTGLNRALRQLQDLGVDVEDLKDTMSGIASAAADVIRSGVPVKTGRLLSSIRPNRAKSKAVVAGGRAAIPYAGVQNYGWPSRGISGKFFMQRADAQQERWVQMLNQGVSEAISKNGLD